MDVPARGAAVTRAVLAAGSLAFLGACAVGAPPPPGELLEAENDAVAVLELEVLGAADVAEREAVAAAAAWWGACGYPVVLVEGRGVPVRILEEVVPPCTHIGSVGCYTPGVGVFLSRTLEAGSLETLAGHEIGHVLGFDHGAPGGVMAERVELLELENAECPPTELAR